MCVIRMANKTASDLGGFVWLMLTLVGLCLKLVLGKQGAAYVFPQFFVAAFFVVALLGGKARTNQQAGEALFGAVLVSAVMWGLIFAR